LFSFFINEMDIVLCPFVKKTERERPTPTIVRRDEAVDSKHANSYASYMS
jgi:hypothetical protein